MTDRIFLRHRKRRRRIKLLLAGIAAFLVLAVLLGWPNAWAVPHVTVCAC